MCRRASFHAVERPQGRPRGGERSEPERGLPCNGVDGCDGLHIVALLHSAQDQPSRHRPPPLTDPSLEGSQQLRAELPRIFLIQLLQDRLGDAVGLLLQPENS